MALKLKIRTALALVLGAAVVVTSSCTEKQRDSYDYVRITVDGQQTLGISKKSVMIRGVVVFFHGVDDNEFTPTSDEAHRSITDKLVNAGFAIVASHAGGNSFGTQASQNHYLQLGMMASGHYKAQNIFVLAEDMGALSAVNLLAMVQSLRVRGLAAINPVLNLSTVTPDFESVMAQNFPNDADEDAVDPMRFPPEAFRDKKMKFYVSPNDSRVPPDTNALEFQTRFGSEADIDVVQCSGAHGDSSCYQGDDVLKWFTRLEKRS